MINSKFKRIYSIVFTGIALIPVGGLCWALAGMNHEVTTAPDPGDIGVKLLFVIGIPMFCIFTAIALLGILCLYSGLKYFLFEPEKKPLRIVWNIVKLMGSVLFFMFFLFPYWP